MRNDKGVASVRSLRIGQQHLHALLGEILRIHRDQLAARGFYLERHIKQHAAGVFLFHRGIAGKCLFQQRLVDFLHGRVLLCYRFRHFIQALFDGRLHGRRLLRLQLGANDLVPTLDHLSPLGIAVYAVAHFTLPVRPVSFRFIGRRLFGHRYDSMFFLCFLPGSFAAIGCTGLMASLTFIPFIYKAAAAGRIVRLMLFGSGGMGSRSHFRLHHIALGVQWAMAIYAFIMSRPEAAKAGGIIRRELLGSAGMLSRSLFRLHHIALGVQRAMAIYTFIMSRPEAAKAGGVICGEFFRSTGMGSRSRFPLNRFPLGVAGLVALAALVPTALITAVAGGVVSLVPFCAGGVLSDSAFITGTHKHFRVSHCIAAPAAILT